jgi:phosphatidylinositol alpha-1,6-mannosyltransferase
MRVLLVTNDFPPKPGGIQQYLGNIAERFEGELRVLAPAHPGAPDAAGVVRGERTFLWPTRATRRWMGAQIAEFDPDVVLFGAPHPLAQLGPSLRRTTGVPYGVMTHGAEVTVPAIVPGLRQILARPLREADLVFAVSRSTAARVSALAAREVTVLGAGVDLEAFHPVGDGDRRLVIGCVSRFIPRKGHIRVIAAAERLAAAGVEAEVLIVGKGRLERRIRRRAAGASIPVRMEVDVPWERLPGLYREMDVFAMPARSRWAGLEVEGLGIVYLEAAATGIPVLAGSSGGAPETVVPGVTGFVATGVDEIVEALRLVLPRRREMGAAARDMAERRFSWEAVLARFEEGLGRAAAHGSVS